MRLVLLRLQVNQTFGGGRSGVQVAPGAVRRSEGSTTTSQRSKRDRDTEPDLMKPRYPSKDFHHKEFAKKLRDGFRGLREKRKELNHNFEGNSEGNSYVSRRPLLQAQRTRCAQFFLFCLSLAGGSFTHVVRLHVELLTP